MDQGTSSVVSVRGFDTYSNGSADNLTATKWSSNSSSNKMMSFLSRTTSASFNIDYFSHMLEQPSSFKSKSTIKDYDKSIPKVSVSECQKKRLGSNLFSLEKGKKFGEVLGKIIG